jgi:hypothetical protein
MQVVQAGEALGDEGAHRSFESETVSAHLAARHRQGNLLRVLAVLAVMVTGTMVYWVSRPPPIAPEWTAFAFRV